MKGDDKKSKKRRKRKERSGTSERPEDMEKEEKGTRIGKDSARTNEKKGQPMAE